MLFWLVASSADNLEVGRKIQRVMFEAEACVNPDCCYMAQTSREYVVVHSIGLFANWIKVSTSFFLSFAFPPISQHLPRVDVELGRKQLFDLLPWIPTYSPRHRSC
jgi:hypothetical protein